MEEIVGVSGEFLQGVGFVVFASFLLARDWLVNRPKQRDASGGVNNSGGGVEHYNPTIAELTKQITRLEDAVAGHSAELALRERRMHRYELDQQKTDGELQTHIAVCAEKDRARERWEKQMAGRFGTPTG